MWLAGPAGITSPRNSPRITPRPTQVNGANIPSKYSSLRGRGFSCFEYFEQKPGSSPRATGSPRRELVLMNDGSSLHGGSGMLSDRPIFKHSALPPAPQQAGSFQRFRYATDPYERNEDHKRHELRETKTKTIAGSFMAGGNARDERRMLKRRAGVRARPHRLSLCVFLNTARLAAALAFAHTLSHARSRAPAVGRVAGAQGAAAANPALRLAQFPARGDG